MSIEKDLQQLKEQPVNEAVKQQNINRISTKLQQVKRVTYAKTAAITFSVIALLFVLLIPVTERIPETATMTTLEDKKEIESMYVQNAYENKYNVTPTTFRIGIVKVREESERLTEDFLSQLEGTTKPEYNPDYYSLIEWVDGTSTKLEIYHIDNHVIFYDYGNDTFYRSLTEVDLFGFYEIYEPRSSANQALWVLGASLILLFIGQFYIDRKLRHPEDPKRKLPRVSTPWQTVATIAFVGITVSSILFIDNLHLFWLLMLVFIHAAIFTWLELRNGQNKWRIILVLFQSVYVVVYFFLITQSFSW